ncbi:NblA-related protein [Synechococcales cyanobacterium C]|uniref:NblA-related protein n=1 Tax=Petrachloros mirabilis ULC683 TaxID=2781853 RepID=A0A8K1ZW52_9CYAN|nr:NblA/ycf18 family protein [Petrachloros mirabilis]NCJ05186.1 NblA-related protein [Petrachloros mirabilis ULC683]
MKPTLEQQFEIEAYKQRIKNLDREQCQLALVSLYALMLERDNHYKALLREKWGIGQ